jgi:hypothetical protein
MYVFILFLRSDVMAEVAEVMIPLPTDVFEKALDRNGCRVDQRSADDDCPKITAFPPEAVASGIIVAPELRTPDSASAVTCTVAACDVANR